MPLLGSTMEGRDHIFQRLKPSCVALNQAALALHGPQSNVQSVTDRLEDLHKALASATAQGKSNSLDAKLADYAFFPLSQVLKVSQRVSVRCLELSLQCLDILIEHGWRAHLQPPLAAQILILCTLMAEKSPKLLASGGTTDDLQASAFSCLHHLFSAVGSSLETRTVLVDEGNVPQLGQTISTILDGIHDGGSVDSQIHATNALQALIKSVVTRDIQAGFLPGIVSKLTRVLTPQTKQRRHPVVLVGALDTLCYLFHETLNDEPFDGRTVQLSRPQLSTSKVIDTKWLETAATQLKPAVTKIVRLRDHGRSDVRDALAQLCFIVLKQCRKTLENCASVCLETVLLLSSEQTGEATKFRLEALITADNSIFVLLQNNIHGWLQSLPTQMQGADEQLKVHRMQQITTAYGLVTNSGADSRILDKLLASVLRDSVVITLQLPGIGKQATPNVSQVRSLDTTIADSKHPSMEFTSPLVRYKAQEEVLDTIQSFTQTISRSSSSSAFMFDISRSLRQSHGEVRIADFWLLLNATATALRPQTGVDDLLYYKSNSEQVHTECLEDLYSFSLQILADTSEEPVDPRLQALALRTLALRAQIAGAEFQHEMVDVLYPVLHTLATPDDRLQQDSITTLNIFTEACGYSSVKDLIVDNVDYLTNSVSLKLNGFDVSPQVPQVLLMMVRLAGHALLPYLEDTVDGIFAALEDYHGYPLLVELLFKVLGVMAEEGTKLPQLAITGDTRKNLLRVRQDSWQPVTMALLAEQLEERVTEELQLRKEQTQREPHPKKPWKTERNLEHAEENEDNALEDEGQVADIPDPPPPAPKTYKLLLKITELTQHFLPSASASLRTSLLALIKTTTPAIARHENSFYPLINTLWPEIVSRLDDTEPYVVALALEIIGILCEHAGDFMRTRILQLWPALVELHRKTAKSIVQVTGPTITPRSKEQNSMVLIPSEAQLRQAISRMRSVPADYSDTSTRIIWTALVDLFTVVVKHVAIQPEIFDEALGMLEPVLDQLGVREALESENPDAVWLVRMRNGSLPLPELPKMDEYVHMKFAAAVK